MVTQSRRSSGLHKSGQADLALSVKQPDKVVLSDGICGLQPNVPTHVHQVLRRQDVAPVGRHEVVQLILRYLPGAMDVECGEDGLELRLL